MRALTATPHLQRAWAKYGAKAFTFRVLEQCLPRQLMVCEQHYLSLRKPSTCYNIGPVVSGLGRKRSQETKERLRQSHLGKKLAPETRAKLSQLASTPARKKRQSELARSRKGYKCSPEAVERLRQGAIRRASDPAERKRRSEWAKGRHKAGMLGIKGRKHSPETISKMRATHRRISADPEERKRRSERARAQHASGGFAKSH